MKSLLIIALALASFHAIYASLTSKEQDSLIESCLNKYEIKDVNAIKKFDRTNITHACANICFFEKMGLMENGNFIVEKFGWDPEKESRFVECLAKVERSSCFSVVEDEKCYKSILGL